MAKKPVTKKDGGREAPTPIPDVPNEQFLKNKITELYCTKCRALVKIADMREDKDGYYFCKLCNLE